MLKRQVKKVLQKAERALFHLVRNNAQKFILCAVFCMALLLSVFPEESAPVMTAKAEGGYVITSSVTVSETEVWIGETAGNNGNLVRAQLRSKEDERRLSRVFTVLFFFVSTALSGLFLDIDRILYYFGERFVAGGELIIRFIHDLDGRKRITA